MTNRSMQNHTGSNPLFSTKGMKIGTRIKRIEIHSRKKPARKTSARKISSSPQGPTSRAWIASRITRMPPAPT